MNLLQRTRTPAGWYQDPLERAAQRHWNGHAWTAAEWDGTAAEGREPNEPVDAATLGALDPPAPRSTAELLNARNATRALLGAALVAGTVYIVHQRWSGSTSGDTAEAPATVTDLAAVRRHADLPDVGVYPSALGLPSFGIDYTAAGPVTFIAADGTRRILDAYDRPAFARLVRDARRKIPA